MTMRRPLGLLAAACAAALGAFLASRAPAEIAFLTLVTASGLATGSLALLMIGHLMGEAWLKPIRAEAEAAALSTPLLLAVAAPLSVSLGALYPWADGATDALPPLRAAFLTPSFFLLRGALYLLVWIGLAVWIVRARHVRRASAIGLALLAPTSFLAANDWVLFREPTFWSGLFGFAFTLNQLLAALAGAILVSLLRPEHPSPARMMSLERALLTLALLVLWTWFVHFLIVWLGNLPHEAAWYLRRSDAALGPLLAGALAALVAAVVLLLPSGVGRKTMIAGSALILIQHLAHMLWLAGLPLAEAFPDGRAALFGLALAGVWGAWFTVALRGRPTFASEAHGEP